MLSGRSAYGGHTQREPGARVLNQSMPEQLMHADLSSKYLSMTSRQIGGSSNKKKQIFIPGVTEVTEDDDEEEGLQIPETDASLKRKAMAQNAHGMDMSADMGLQAYQSVRHSTLGISNDLMFHGKKQQTSQQNQALKDATLKAEKAEMKVLKYKRLFHQVNLKLNNQSKLYMD